MPCSGTRKCLCCHTFFTPHVRSKGRQKYCSQSDCQKASKRASQQKWLQKSQNIDYFSGPENVRRVQQWRANNPGYSKKASHSSPDKPPLQDDLIAQVIEKQEQKPAPEQQALQEIITSQPVVLIGLIAHLTGSTLQDDIVRTGRKLRELGEDLLHEPNLTGEHHAIPSHSSAGTFTPDTGPIQLDRPPIGT